MENLCRSYFRVAGIYCILAPLAGSRLYIGSSVDLYKRISYHRVALERGDHHNAPLQAYYNKYGGEGIEAWVLKVVKGCGIEKLRELEKIYLELYEKNYGGWNKILFNTSRETARPTMSAEGMASFKKKMKEHWVKNRKKMLSISRINIKKAAAEKRKLRLAGVRYKSPMKGKKLDPILNKETMEKMSIAAKRRGPHKGVMVRVFAIDDNLEVVKEYPCAKHAAIEISGNPKLASNITAVCRGKRNKAFGFLWEYVPKQK